MWWNTSTGGTRLQNLMWSYSITFTSLIKSKATSHHITSECKCDWIWPHHITSESNAVVYDFISNEISVDKVIFFLTNSVLELVKQNFYITSESNDVVYDITSNENETRLKISYHITHSIQQRTIWYNPWNTNAIQCTATKDKTMEYNNIHIILTNTTLCHTDTIQCNANYTINQMDLYVWLYVIVDDCVTMNVNMIQCQQSMTIIVVNGCHWIIFIQTHSDWFV